MTWHTTLDETDQYVICELYSEGSGIVELARQFRARTSLINSVLAENGVQRKTKTASTPIECRLHDALRAAGIGFSTQKRLADRYVVDIVLHQAPVIIEADGAMHRWKPDARERDALRDVTHELAGYQVFRFTGSEINTDAVACIQRVIAACGLVPDEDPVFDIRTKFTGPDHPRYVGLYELTCLYCGNAFMNKRKIRKYCSHEHYVLGVQKGKPKSDKVRAALAESNRRRGRNSYFNQIMRESDLRGDLQRPAETTGPATLF
jgi:very-short-patch-repair endonuclease